MNKIITTLRKFNHEREWEQFHTFENLVKSISIESSELLECFQWGYCNNYHEIKNEISDIFIYLLILCDKFDMGEKQIKENIYKKIEMNAKKYPVK